VVALGEAEEDERRDRARELERDDAVDLALAQADPEQRDEPVTSARAATSNAFTPAPRSTAT
jgi:hypothetical protein